MSKEVTHFSEMEDIVEESIEQSMDNDISQTHQMKK